MGKGGEWGERHGQSKMRKLSLLRGGRRNKGNGRGKSNKGRGEGRGGGRRAPKRIRTSWQKRVLKGERPQTK